MIRWQGVDLELVDESYNTTILNERAVELAIAKHWLEKRPAQSDGLELGNVTSHYWPSWHRIVDLHEEAEGVENLDVFDIEGEYDWILSISTIEHVWWDDRRHPTGAAHAINHLLNLLRPGGAMLVTVPLGWNVELDSRLPMNADFWRCYHRHGEGWRPGALEPTPYGPRWANALWVGEWA